MEPASAPRPRHLRLVRPYWTEKLWAYRDGRRVLCELHVYQDTGERVLVRERGPWPWSRWRVVTGVPRELGGVHAAPLEPPVAPAFLGRKADQACAPQPADGAQLGALAVALGAELARIDHELRRRGVYPVA